MTPDVAVVIPLNRFLAPEDDTVTAHTTTQSQKKRAVIDHSAASLLRRTDVSITLDEAPLASRAVNPSLSGAADSSTADSSPEDNMKTMAGGPPPMQPSDSMSEPQVCAREQGPRSCATMALVRPRKRPPSTPEIPSYQGPLGLKSQG